MEKGLFDYGNWNKDRVTVSDILNLKVSDVKNKTQTKLLK